MFRLIPAAVAFAVATTLAISLSGQTQAQPQAPSPVPATATQQPPPPTTSVADTEYGTEILLLERIQKVLDEAADGQTGTVKMDRGMLDELRSEVTQVRLALKARTVRGS